MAKSGRQSYDGGGYRRVREVPPSGQRREKPLLSDREKRLFSCGPGFRNREIGEKLLISEQTVKNHLHNIFDKLGVSDRLELALYAIHHRLIDQT